MRVGSVVAEASVSQIGGVWWRSLVRCWRRGQRYWQLQGRSRWENWNRTGLNRRRVCSSVKERCIFAKQRLPLGPVINIREKVVLHVAEEFDLHDVNFGNVDARYLSPGFVRICVVVQEFVAQHKGNREEPVFASRLTLDGGVEFLQAVNEEQCQKNNVLGHQSGGENCGDPFTEASRGSCIFDQFSGWL